MARNTQGSGNNSSNRSSTKRSGSSSGRSNSSSARKSSSSARSQYTGSGVIDLARDRPIAAAAVAAGAAAAGLFLWSRRAQISDQLGSLSDQIGEWTDNMMSSSDTGDWNDGDDTGGLTTAGGTGDTSSI